MHYYYNIVDLITFKIQILNNWVVVNIFIIFVNKIKKQQIQLLLI